MEKKKQLEIIRKDTRACEIDEDMVWDRKGAGRTREQLNRVGRKKI